MNQNIADKIDKLLLAEKLLAGTPEFESSPRPNQFRWGGSLEINNEACGLKLWVDAQPDGFRQPFTITLNATTCVWRAEFVEMTSHLNNHPCPPTCDVGLIYGPHFHSWEDNRHLATPKKLPNLLKFGKPLPPNIQGLENALRWFCGETNIVINFNIPDYPRSDLLL